MGSLKGGGYSSIQINGEVEAKLVSNLLSEYKLLKRKYAGEVRDKVTEADWSSSNTMSADSSWQHDFFSKFERNKLQAHRFASKE